MPHANHMHDCPAPGAEESTIRRRTGSADAGAARWCSDGVLPACRCYACAQMGAQRRGCMPNTLGHAAVRRRPSLRAAFLDGGTHHAPRVHATGPHIAAEPPWRAVMRLGTRVPGSQWRLVTCGGDWDHYGPLVPCTDLTNAAVSRNVASGPTLAWTTPTRHRDRAQRAAGGNTYCIIVPRYDVDSR